MSTRSKSETSAFGKKVTGPLHTLKLGGREKSGQVDEASLADGGQLISHGFGRLPFQGDKSLAEGYRVAVVHQDEVERDEEPSKRQAHQVLSA
jgi:hypothetical protein